MCDNSSTASAAEIEVDAIAQFFGKACRPGAWSNNRNEDRRLSEFENEEEKMKTVRRNLIFFFRLRLEEKYPQLCELCSSLTRPCDYNDDIDLMSRHTHALHCLLDKGHVAYVSLQEAINFFASVRSFSRHHFVLLLSHFSAVVWLLQLSHQSK